MARISNSAASMPRVLFRPKGPVAELTDAQWTALNPVHTDRPIREAYARQARMQGTDYTQPRRVCGEHRGIKAEGWHATATYSDEYKKRELKR